MIGDEGKHASIRKEEFAGEEEDQPIGRAKQRGRRAYDGSPALMETPAPRKRETPLPLRKRDESRSISASYLIEGRIGSSVTLPVRWLPGSTQAQRTVQHLRLEGA